MLRLFAVLVAVAALAGCGRNFCKDTVKDTHGTCDTSGTTTTAPPANCSEDKCTDQDVEKLNDMYDCFDGLTPCEKGKEADYGTAALACAAKGNVSTPCADGLAGK